MALTTTQTKTPPPVRPAPARSRYVRRERNVFTGLSHVALVVWSITVILPILWTFLGAFKTNTELFGSALSLPSELRLDAWGRAWERAHVGQYMINSVIVVTFSTAGTMLFGSMAAYVLARYPFRGNRMIYFLFVAGLVFPIYLALVPLFLVVLRVGEFLGQAPLIGSFLETTFGLNSHGGLILVYIAYSLPFTVFFMAAFFRTLPTSVAEAAMIDGASHTRTFFQIMVPMAKPGLISITIFNVLGQWNQYLLPLVLLSTARDKWVLTQGIADISVTAGYEADWPGLFAALSMAIIPMIIIYVIFQRQIQAGLTAGAVK
ncbi:MAG TPA: carbohydrate ABC transporter permease [Actinophytocola sp.]|uniref:carbohydrate ABC transporter permease n=1 Tax=Actinophytocola sp. TaxID=1872138 RepID=UPI002DDD8AD8|nr:carbohydrate ABC transporter permease [Actinophytocola sp.]HEV2782369.1 carbohydrate ABC transporter permease [Actinophytocola sp.]